jgi:hypothetical protein
VPLGAADVDGADVAHSLGTTGSVQGDPVPTLLVRAISTRPALPWDQAAAARLDARMNAPLPLEQVTFVLRRLERWKLNTQGRYAAVYARHDEVRSGLVATVYLDGKSLEVRFPSPERLKRNTRLLVVIVVSSTIVTFLAVATVASILSVRHEAATRLATLEAAVATRLHQAREADAAAAKVQALESADLEGRRASAVLADLNWTAAAKTPEARIEGFFRQGELLAVEVRGDENPFVNVDRPVQRSKRSIRRGVWLWGVSDSKAQVEGQP